MNLYFSAEDEAELRRQMLTQLRAIVPAEYAQQVVDLAFHATRQSIDSFGRVVGSSGDQRMQLAVLSPAAGLLKGLAEMIEKGCRDFAEEHGMLHAERSIGINRT